MEPVRIIKEYDANGKIIYSRYSDGWEEWHEYDASGNEIHYKNSNGYEYWQEFDANGNLIHNWDNNENHGWYWDWESTKDPIKILVLQHKIREKANLAK